MKEITILPGFDKSGKKEKYDKIVLRSGELWAVVGETGAGKSRFIKDIEMLVAGDSVTKRHILVDGRSLSGDEREHTSDSLISHLGQRMNFTLDLSVGEFLALHFLAAGKKEEDTDEIARKASLLSGESFGPDTRLSLLSGGQARALMTSDTAFVSDRPVVLVDEIENAGIDKTKALGMLLGRGKLVLLVTHDPHTALLAGKRIVIKNGGVESILERSSGEEKLFLLLDEEYRRRNILIRRMRNGEALCD